jgi:hypothetical protein
MDERSLMEVLRRFWVIEWGMDERSLMEVLRRFLMVEWGIGGRSLSNIAFKRVNRNLRAIGDKGWIMRVLNRFSRPFDEKIPNFFSENTTNIWREW